MSTEIEQLESTIRRLRHDLAKEEAKLERWMTDSRPPEKDNIYGINTMEKVNEFLMRGYWLCNYTPGYIALFMPNGGGSYGGIYGALADELGAMHDRWNFDVHKQRRELPQP